MTKLERACLSYFVADYQRVITQIKAHDNYLDELLEEEDRIRNQLAWLEEEKEKILNRFAEAMLRPTSEK